MVNDDLTCREPRCPGRMVPVRTRPDGKQVAGDPTSHVEYYACDTCGAEDWA